MSALFPLRRLFSNVRSYTFFPRYYTELCSGKPIINTLMTRASSNRITWENVLHCLRAALFFLALIPSSVFAQDTTQHVVEGRSNKPGMEKRPYLILISADGFRWDLADKYHAANLLALRDGGVKADFMQPSYPSLTFPNHYTIVTGLYPAHHGLVDNSFYDPARKASYSLGRKETVADSSWYGGTPLWNLAEKQGMLTASFYWVGSEAAIQGIRPTYYYKFSTKIPLEDRINDVKNWLKLPEENRPHLIFFYIPDVDHEEHLHTAESKQTEAAVLRIDSAIGLMVKTLEELKLPLNYIFLSDHGMTAVDTENTIPRPVAIDTTQFRVLNSQTLAHIYARDSTTLFATTEEALKAQADGYKVYSTEEVPERFHYGGLDDRYHRTGDLIMIADPPRVFHFKDYHEEPGTHGYDPELPDMHATFYAWGPAFKEHLSIPGFENVHVFPLITHLMKLSQKEKIDGEFKVLKKILK